MWKSNRLGIRCIVQWGVHVFNARQRLAVLGGGGAVGLSAIQLASAAGADVACTCGMRSMERVKAAGATRVIDYATVASEDLKHQFKGQFDAVLDTIGMEETEEAGVEMLKPGGHYMTLQGEVVKLADLYGLVLGGARAAANLFQKQLLYKNSHGIGSTYVYAAGGRCWISEG
ncbi:hypothetical protein CBR_g49987 [Chara braunii]|uniref:Alcohol dehydrogenase-like C-terminal domain-containing protein n=1 Tax=Chara braunii TaxID=69332 RepID=A0A388K580_CHABU|nr:hypothetical protein CBR_g49987 [Chara braunii]|eukprot:GBG65195.1 hypothetical protein CBR_g49987 [Chara braunii]